MNRCANCGDQVTWNKRSSLCGECYESELEIKLDGELINADRVVESPHASWF